MSQGPANNSSPAEHGPSATESSEPTMAWQIVEGEGPVPRGVDPTVPNVARMYDYYLGGRDNYAADREAADKVLSRYPELREVCRVGREFLIELVQTLAGEGVRQFLDVGSGLPTRRNVHTVAREVAPDARVVYADYDRVVVRHAQALLPGERGRTAVIEADLREPEAILGHHSTQELIDFSQPTLVLLISVLHFIQESEDPYGAVRRLMAPMAPGSYLAIVHAGGMKLPDRAHDAAIEYRQATAQMAFRDHEQVMRFFEGMEFLEPGLVPVGQWRGARASTPELAELLATAGLVGVARKL